jgi:hypothetical protein
MLDQNICTLATPRRPSLLHEVPLQSAQGDVLRMSPPTPTTANHRIVNSWLMLRCIRLHIPEDLISHPITNWVALHLCHKLSLRVPQALQYAHNICPDAKGLDFFSSLARCHTTTDGSGCRTVSMQALLLGLPCTGTRR